MTIVALDGLVVNLEDSLAERLPLYIAILCNLFGLREKNYSEGIDQRFYDIHGSLIQGVAL